MSKKPKAYIYGHPESECSWYQLSEDNTGFDGHVELLFICDADEAAWAITQEDWELFSHHHGAYNAKHFTWHGRGGNA